MEARTVGGVGLDSEDFANEELVPLVPAGPRKRTKIRTDEEDAEDDEHLTKDTPLPGLLTESSEEVAKGLLVWLAAAGGASIALRISLAITLAFGLIFGAIVMSDILLLAVPVLLLVPLGVGVGTCACVGAGCWSKRWALLYSGMLGLTSFNSFLGIIGIIVAAIYMAFASTIANEGTAPIGEYVFDRALVFQLIAVVLFIAGIFCILLDFAIAYLTAALRYIIDNDVANPPEETEDEE